MSDTPRLALPLIAAAQAQKHVTHNEALAALDALVHLSVASGPVDAPPAAPADGLRLWVGANPTGAFAGRAGRIALREDGAWRFLEPKAGWLLHIESERALLVHDGGGFRPLGRLGINAAPDTANRLVARLAAGLFTDEGAGVQLKLNKTGPGDTASWLFQTGYSGRAEFGLVGGDDFVLKVSPDGATWLTALSVNRSTGAVTLTGAGGGGAPSGPASEVSVFTASGSWTKPAWASRVTAILIGGGGGGGSGRRGAAASARSGGGGGGAGGYAERTLIASEIGPVLTVTVGAGGDGGTAQSVDNANGRNGADGGASQIADGATVLLRATGGGGGSGGRTTTATGGSGGSGDWSSTSAGGAGANQRGGAAAALPLLGPGAGGGGGGLSAANVVAEGGPASAGGAGDGPDRMSPGGTAGGVSGAGGAGSPKTWARGCGGGGGGGGSGDVAGGIPAGTGGPGGAPGGGGGGGGGATNGALSGDGGSGARGEVWIIAWR